MASVDKRLRDGKVSWLARWRDPEGRQRKKSFTRKGDADRFASTIGADVVRGQYVDPGAGKVTVADYAGRWLANQTFDQSTREAVALRLRLHVYPTLGRLQIAHVKPSTVQGWLRNLDALAPTYRSVIFANLSSVFTAAVDDEIVTKNPCSAASVRRPRIVQRKVVPWEASRVLAVRDHLPERYAILASLAAGLGLRQGEVFGLSPDDVDFLRGWVHVRRQVKLFGNGSQSYALPKARKTRDVPLPDGVRDDLAAYLSVFPARGVTLPWSGPGVSESTEVTVPLILTSRESRAMNRNYFNSRIWKPALVGADVEPTRDNGCHALRHFFASTLLDAGESIRAVSEYLGHADPGFTLRVYTHLMPASETRTRRAVDAALYDTAGAPDVPRIAR